MKKHYLHVSLSADVNYLLCRHQVCNAAIVVFDILNMLKCEVWIMLMKMEWGVGW